MRSLLVAVAFAVATVACGSAASVGPLRLEVPDGWTVTHARGSNLQIADGTAGDPETEEAGTATAVFDVYTASPHTPSSYRDVLRERRTEFTERTLQLDDREAVVFEYSGEAFAGSQIAVVVGDYRVLIVYRAAYPYDRRAFVRGRDEFLRAVRSIRFVRPPPAGRA